MSTNSDSSSAKTGQINSLSVLGARLTWIIVGPAVLLGLTFGIVSSGSGWVTALDIAFCVVAGLMLLGRWVEQRSGSATDSRGEPATPEQLRRYVSTLIPVAATIWLMANVLGNHILD